ncbi:MAG: RHS repeat protein, partial [Lachnospiraceae bacterium]|nr:RHS repeat protein [Lachnospiraceae bacterium]
MGLIKKLGKKKLFILFGSIAGVIVIACVLIISGVFKKKDKGPGYDIPEVPDGYVLVFRLVSEYDVAAGGKTPITLCEYDERGNILVKKEKYRHSGYEEFDRISEYTYDSQDRPIRIKTTFPSGDFKTEEREYNSNGQLISSETTSGAEILESCRFQYDEAGNLALEEHYGADGKLTESYAYESDENGFAVFMDQKKYEGIELWQEMIVRWTRRADGSLEKFSALEREYDVNGVSSENEREYLYDESENLIAEYRVHNGIKFDEIEYECTYDDDGRLREYMGPSGTTDYYEYDKKGRVVSIESWDATMHYVYDSYGNVIKEYLTEKGQDPTDIAEYTEYVYKPFSVRKDLLTDDERDRLEREELGK